MNLKWKFLKFAIGLAVGNFIWQAFTGRHWDIAIERSWFQGFACLACSFIKQ